MTSCQMTSSRFASSRRHKILTNVRKILDPPLSKFPPKGGCWEPCNALVPVVSWGSAFADFALGTWDSVVDSSTTLALLDAASVQSKVEKTIGRQLWGLVWQYKHFFSIFYQILIGQNKLLLCQNNA
jgi:hypothetical protein